MPHVVAVTVSVFCQRPVLRSYRLRCRVGLAWVLGRLFLPPAAVPQSVGGSRCVARQQRADRLGLFRVERVRGFDELGDEPVRIVLRGAGAAAALSTPFGVENLAALRAATAGSGGGQLVPPAGRVNLPPLRGLIVEPGSAPRLGAAQCSHNKPQPQLGHASIGSGIKQSEEPLGPRLRAQPALLAFEPESPILCAPTVHGYGQTLCAGFRASAFRRREFPPSVIAGDAVEFAHGDLLV